MEAWGPSQVQELLQSIIDGIPIGAVLLLEVSGEPEFAYRVLEGAPEEGEPVREMILDGQQRLTALWRALNDDYPHDRYFLRISTDGSVDPEDLPIVERVRLYCRGGKTFPMWVSSPEQVYARGLIPISLLNPDREREANEWVDRVTARESREAYKALNQQVGKYREQVKHFEIPYIRLKAGTEPEAVIATFTKHDAGGCRCAQHVCLLLSRSQQRPGNVDLRRSVLDSGAAVRGELVEKREGTVKQGLTTPVSRTWVEELIVKWLHLEGFAA